MKRLISKDQIAEMYGKYSNGESLYDLSRQYGWAVTSIWYAFKRNGYAIRTPKDAGPMQGVKRSGDNHWQRKSPQPIADEYYRSQRIVDEDGLSHKRRLHVITMEKHLGRRLFQNEVVHHVNGDKHDNRLENLQLMDRSEHSVMEMKMIRRTRPEKFIREIDPSTGRFKKQGVDRESGLDALPKFSRAHEDRSPLRDGAGCPGDAVYRG